MPSEAAAKADFSRIRYAQVWEDADVLLQGLEIGPEDECLSIASAGDNALAMLAMGPRKVIALDLNPAQLFCLELRVVAFRNLEHREILELIGSVDSVQRQDLYRRIRKDLTPECRVFWDGQSQWIACGVGHAGKFEGYFRIFRERVMPLVHSKHTINRLLEPRDAEDRRKFFQQVWNTRRWRWMFHLFFSRTAMGALGRDPRFFDYVEGSVASKILSRTEHALMELDPHANPFLHWILTGRHGTALPFYLRRENFETIRGNLNKIEWHLAPLEDFLVDYPSAQLSKFNLSDIFEYLSEDKCRGLLEQLADASRPGARMASWNMLAPRQASAMLPLRLRLLAEQSQKLHLEDKAFFYSAFRVEEFL